MKAANTHSASGREGLQPVAEYVRMSTDHQRYSIDNQSALIQAYAAAHSMQIVRRYADPGRSGLTMRERPGLSSLLSDILGGNAEFEIVLVYDVSRWGRFQDADESAHYEFLCRRAGVRLIYCAEQFTSDGTPFGGVLKALKRAMAGEYSRELSVKVAAGKARIGRLGFRVGGIAGYGLRRQVMEDGRTPGPVLRDHQRKSIATDRVTLVPGPPEEIALVRRMYRDYIYLRRSERQIAAALTAEGQTFCGRPWSRNLVRTVLANEKYIGNNIVGQFCQRLRTPQIVRPPDEWTRCDGAFAPIVSRQLFDAAARVRTFNEKRYVTREQILTAVRRVLKREGHLSANIINRAPELPSANTVGLRFGSLSELYEAIGYVPASRYRHHNINRALRAVRESVLQALLASLPHATLEANGLLHLANGCAVELIACRHQMPRSYLHGWRLSYMRNLGGSVLVAIRMKPGNKIVRDLLVVPRAAVSELPLLVRDRDDAAVCGFRHATLSDAVKALKRLEEGPAS